MQKRFTNKTDNDIHFLTGHVIPANGFLDIDARPATKLCNEGYVIALINTREIEVGDASSEPPKAITRKDVAKMTGPELKEILEAHNASSDGTLRELRDRATAVMFVDL